MNFCITTIITILVTAQAARGFKLDDASTPCICPLTYQPICGSDLHTYGNECFFTCAQATHPGLTIFSLGECPKPSDIFPEVEQHLSDPAQDEDKGCICSLEYRPVCGIDMQTYGNICFFNCAKKENPTLEILSQGECPTQEGVALVDAPQKKPTPFRLNKREVSQISCVCTREYRPTCGSNGITYSNPCELKCAQKSHPSLTILNKGPCQAENDVE